MPTLIDLRRRIQSVRNSQQITQAMKTVSTAKFRKAQRTVQEARPFWHLFPELMDRLAYWAAAGTHPLLLRRDEKKIEVIVITADKGLAGAYNSNLLAAADAFIAGKAETAERPARPHRQEGGRPPPEGALSRGPGLRRPDRPAVARRAPRPGRRAHAGVHVPEDRRRLHRHQRVQVHPGAADHDPQGPADRAAARAGGLGDLASRLGARGRRGSRPSSCRSTWRARSTTPSTSPRPPSRPPG